MCGILGWQGNLQRKRFNEALDLMQHRGPDDRGVEAITDTYLFGHRRLSIIDLSENGHQPMDSIDGRYTIVFNGEIYNYKELQNELRAKGYQFRSHSDTEVLLAAWHEWNQECLHKLIGMFAFAIYDKQKNTTYLVRDRFGIKPLYFYSTEQQFGFASEVKSLLHLIPEKPNINLTSVASFFSFRYPVTQESFFQEVAQLQPGHLLIKEANKTPRIHRYYHLANILKNTPSRTVDDSYIAEVKKTFESAVNYRLISDVPVGAYLSGGLDSSGVVAQMRQMQKSEINSYTIGFDEPGFNEFSYAQQVAEQCKTQHHELLHSPDDYLQQMADLIALKDAPLGVPNEVSLYKLSIELKKKITVVLSGEGADESFAGYGRIFRSAFDYDRLKLLSQLPAELSFEEKQSLQNRYGDTHFANELSHFFHLYRYISAEDQSGLFTTRLFNHETIQAMEAPFTRCFDEFSDKHYADKMMYSFVHLHLPGLLQRVDTTTMAASVEARVPFVDHRLVELAFQVNAADKMPFKSPSHKNRAANLTGDLISEQFDTPKAILKSAFSDMLPDNIIHRKKVGFPVPLAKWFGAEFQHIAQEQLIDGALLDYGLIHNEYVENIIKHATRKPSHKQGMMLWMLLSMEMFLRQYSPKIAKN